MHSIDQLLSMMAILRHPQKGCPWDRQQNFATIAPYTVEEAYEVADVIERNALDELCAELGDLLLQVVYHAQIASERSLFDFNDVVEAIIDKVEKRHPHVFSDAIVDSAEQLRNDWETQKRRERDSRGAGGLLDNIPAVLPALARAQKLQQRAASVGFDWDNRPAVLEKVHEELAELSAAVAATGQQNAVEEELGDVLFSCVNLARHLQVDAEAALRGAGRKFERRFRHMENQLAGTGETLEGATTARLEELWQEAKQRDK